MYHDNYEREQIEAFAESLRSGACIKKVLISEENTSFFYMCLVTMHDTASYLYSDGIDDFSKLYIKEIGECITYTKAYLRFEKLNETDDNYTAFHKMLRYLVVMTKDCYENDNVSNGYYSGYKDAMLHIIDAFVYAYDIEFA